MGYTFLDGEDPSIEVFMGQFRKVRAALGVTAFGINEIRLPPGAQGREHDEADLDEEEVYVGLAGSGTFTVDGAPVAFGAGQYLRVDPADRGRPRRAAVPRDRCAVGQPARASDAVGPYAL